MTAEPLDLVIVGGGINGAGIARDAAGRGLKVLLKRQISPLALTVSTSFETSVRRGSMATSARPDGSLVSYAFL